MTLYPRVSCLLSYAISITCPEESFTLVASTAQEKVPLQGFTSRVALGRLTVTEVPALLPEQVAAIHKQGGGRGAGRRRGGLVAGRDGNVAHRHLHVHRRGPFQRRQVQRRLAGRTSPRQVSVCVCAPWGAARGLEILWRIGDLKWLHPRLQCSYAPNTSSTFSLVVQAVAQIMKHNVKQFNWLP